ncbi:NAD(P)HX epimerase/NAD(P)HX dehydratase [Gammaproteobacteria bacterium]
MMFMLNTSALLYHVKQIRELENIAILQHGISAVALMQRAGAAAFRELKKHWPKAKNITVVCGKGNNGGDGYVVASLAKKAKLNVQILQLVPCESLTGAAKNAAINAKRLKIKTHPFSAEKLAKSDVVVDALLGTGLTGVVQLQFKVAMDAINASKIPVLAIDLPSGLDADTGNALGAAIRAGLTVTFIGDKVGLHIGEAQDYTGSIICDDLELPQKIFTQVKASAQILNLTEELKSQPLRARIAHKGNFGHVLVIGGDYGMCGAVRMAAEAAARVGAGLISVATRPEHVAMINVARPEIMVHGIEELKQLDPLLQKASVIVLGPGLGISSWSKMLFDSVFAVKKPLVVDADALNILTSNHQVRDNWILTPHPGEAARLLSAATQAVQSNRLDAVYKLQQKFGGVCVLKGAGTLVAAPGEMVRICDAGNPGMASGGMGDILSGIIGGLLAQGLSLFDAAKLGVLVHATAGDLVAAEQGERGMLALDLLPVVRKILNAL